MLFMAVRICSVMRSSRRLASALTAPAAIWPVSAATTAKPAMISVPEAVGNAAVAGAAANRISAQKLSANDTRPARTASHEPRTRMKRSDALRNFGNPLGATDTHTTVCT